MAVSTRAIANEEPQMIKHTGGCHCGEVRFEVNALEEIDVYDCKLEYRLN